MLNIIAAITLTIAPFSAMQSDTSPLPISPERLAQLKSREDIIAATRMGNWTAPPAGLVLPKLVNEATVLSFMQRNYPDSLRALGDIPMPWTWVLIDKRGSVQSARLLKSTGHPILDTLALAAVEIARFEPARANGIAVTVRTPIPVQLPRSPSPDRPPPLQDPDRPYFTPYTVKPQLLNRDEVTKALIQHYPPELRAASVNGTVIVWVFVDETGRTTKPQVKTSSGNEAMDKAAMEVALTMRWSPARNHDANVPVWIQLPITFRAPR